MFAVCTFANAASHFNFDLTGQNIDLTQIENRFQTLLPVSDDVEFIPSRDYTDDLGFRHINYRQYCCGIPVEHCMVMVHSRNGMVTSVNATIMLPEAQPQTDELYRCRMLTTGNRNITTPAQRELLIVTVTDQLGTHFRPAYKTYDILSGHELYLDARTGEIIKNIPTRHSIQPNGTAQTIYSGIRKVNISHDSEHDTYHLIDSMRRIITLDASLSTPQTTLGEFIRHYSTAFEHTPEEQFKTDARKAFSDYVSTCTHFAYTSSDCSASYLTSVTIRTTPEKILHNSAKSNRINISIKIKTPDGTYVYNPDTYHSNVTLPFKFDFFSSPILIPTPGCIIEVYYHGTQGDPDLVGSITIDDLSAGKTTFSNDNLTGSLSLSYDMALDAHWGMEQTYDFYRDIFGRNSYDDNGAQIIQFVAPPQDDRLFSTMPGNAFAQYFNTTPLADLWQDFMAYGRGDGKSLKQMVALDIMAHEFTHLVTSYNGNGGLVYAGESGALNESFSDIMGFAVENHTFGDDDFLIGEDVMIGVSNARSMKHPKRSMDGRNPSPDTYHGSYWVSTDDISADNDNGGVHANSGVQNKWFYLLCQGGSGRNDIGNSYSVQGIGIEKARAIVYRNLTTYLTPEASFAEARNGSLNAAADLYGLDSSEYRSVADAWYAVGIGSNSQGETGTTHPTTDSLTVYTLHHTIFVKTSAATPVSLYDINGRLLHTTHSCTHTSFTVAQDGIYLIKSPSRTVKVIVKQ